MRALICRHWLQAERAKRWKKYGSHHMLKAPALTLWQDHKKIRRKSLQGRCGQQQHKHLLRPPACLCWYAACPKADKHWHHHPVPVPRPAVIALVAASQQVSQGCASPLCSTSHLKQATAYACKAHGVCVCKALPALLFCSKHCEVVEAVHGRRCQ